MSDTFDLGGGGGTNFSWGPVGTQPGAYVQGTVLDMKEVQSTNFETKKPEFWDNGDPKMQYRVTLQTDLRDPTNPADSGQRDVYLDGRRRPNDNGTKSKLCAVLDAVRETTGGTQLQRGGKLTLQWVSGMGYSGEPRCFAAWYEAPALNLGATPPGVAQPAPQPASVDQTIAQQVATAQQPPAFAQPAGGAPVPPPAVQAPSVQQPAQPQLPVAPPAPAPQAAPAAPAGAGPTPEAIAALQAAGVDPATVYPGYVSPTPVG